uniref:RRM domain-containing protein n=1 Tax=Glossina morsitans morsitans TaxID=37546 RepID=A0A1B0FMB7_GLOMM
METTYQIYALPMAMCIKEQVLDDLVRLYANGICFFLGPRSILLVTSADTKRPPIGQKELELYFSKFGQVSSAAIVYDNQQGISKEYRFVTFSSDDDYNSVCNQNLHYLKDALQVSKKPATNNLIIDHKNKHEKTVLLKSLLRYHSYMEIGI